MEGQQRIGALVELPQVLRELGEDPATVIVGAGVYPDSLRNPENAISFVELGRLLEACVAATRCEHFGLLLGQRSINCSATRSAHTTRRQCWPNHNRCPAIKVKTKIESRAA
jgi:hypothetical protein